MHKLAMLIIFEIHLLFLIRVFKWLYKMWSGSEIDKLLHLLIALVNSVIEKEGYSALGYNRTSFNKYGFVGLS